MRGKDGTPSWAYDEDGYCVGCGNGYWRYHGYCQLRDALDALTAAMFRRSVLALGYRRFEMLMSQLRPKNTDVWRSNMTTPAVLTRQIFESLR